MGSHAGAWGSAGNFSIANAMDDTAAALEFARSAAGAKFGIDPHHIVLAGHSMGGATAFMTAAGTTGLDGLILLDAWNIAGGTSKGAVSRDEPQPFDRPETTTAKPPLLTSSFLTAPSRMPT